MMYEPHGYHGHVVVLFRGTPPGGVVMKLLVVVYKSLIPVAVLNASFLVQSLESPPVVF